MYIVLSSIQIYICATYIYINIERHTERERERVDICVDIKFIDKEHDEEQKHMLSFDLFSLL